LLALGRTRSSLAPSAGLVGDDLHAVVLPDAHAAAYSGVELLDIHLPSIGLQAQTTRLKVVPRSMPMATSVMVWQEKEG
jgi:hypothetical protein